MLAYLFLPWDCLVRSRGSYRLGFLSGQISEATEGKMKGVVPGNEKGLQPRVLIRAELQQVIGLL